MNRADQVRTLLADGQLREAEGQAGMLPDGDEKAEVSKQIATKKQELADLLARAAGRRAAVGRGAGREAPGGGQADQRARTRTTRCASCRWRPPGRPRATGDGPSVKVFWQRGTRA